MKKTEMSAFLDELEKIAKEQGSNIPVAVGSGLGGTYALTKAAPLATGRSTYYHGTSESSAAKIRKQGIRPAAKTKVKGVISEGNFPKSWGEKAYVARARSKAQVYAANAARLHGSPGTVLKVSLPEWKKGLATMANPETSGGFEKWKATNIARNKDPKTIESFRKQFIAGGIPKTEAAGLARRHAEAVITAINDPVQSRAAWQAQIAGGERAVNKVPSQYIKGSKNYARLGFKELGQYIRARPGRFAGGLGLGAAGLAGLGYGAYRLTQ